MNGHGIDEEQAPLPPEFGPAPLLTPQVAPMESDLSAESSVPAANKRRAQKSCGICRVFRSKWLLGTLGGTLLLSPLVLVGSQWFLQDSTSTATTTPDAATIRFEQLKTQAAQGDALACYELARCYEQGIGTAPHAAEAQRWLQTAAEHGLPQALLALAEQAYAAERFATAAHYYRAAQPQLSATQLYQLARSLETSDSTTEAHQEALRYYEEAAAQGHADAAYTLGLYYYKGTGVAVSQPEALRLMQQAADSGHTEGLYHMGWMLLQQNNPQTAEQALQYLCQAAEKGHAAACYNAALLLKQRTQNAAAQQQALRYLQCAAEQNHAAALFALSFYYSEGIHMPKNPTQAVRLLEQAAQAGYAPAQYHFAWCLHHGYARHASISAALPWYLRAAAQNNADAKAALSKLWCMKLLGDLRFTKYNLRIFKFGGCAA